MATRPNMKVRDDFTLDLPALPKQLQRQWEFAGGPKVRNPANDTDLDIVETYIREAKKGPEDAKRQNARTFFFFTFLSFL